MPLGHAEERNVVFHHSYMRSDDISMSKTIKAIERHLICQFGPPNSPIRRTGPVAGSGLPSLGSKLVAEWQQRGPETLSGYTSRKLRLAFARAEAVITVSAAS